ncbi:NADH:flavin oxidoreductase/NADH oxidase [Microbacterium proteolyticum]|uniref:NADH:flavin oxidoreductase/NADH oxidase n=1 Tax=Microbacterium proteolyticum TaxID=1572644 RepID=UPI001FAB7F95|nr:NADH:flavin oxidoreductase/NADH oxidase [Microbacterium proteolyticum]MCI9857241.1 NADH:flavin oxidoreductase/NADH oxidase [Microbacterium proteolyticum]
MPHLFTPFTLKGITLRNRIVMSPMTMYRSVDGRMDDYHVSYLGARAAGGFGLIFPEQIAITPDGRTTVSCAGIYDESQLEGLERVCSVIKSMGGTPAIQLGHTGRKGSLVTPWEGGHMLPPDHPKGWQTKAPSAIAYGGDMPYAPDELTIAEIHGLYDAYAQSAKWAVDVGFEWIEMHYAHGYLGAEFLSPLANHRTDQYGGSLANRSRFHLEALDAVRAVIPERIPLTMRLGSDDLNPEGTQFDDAVTAIGWMKEHGLDLADLSFGGNTDDMRENIFNTPRAFVERAHRVKQEVGIPVGASWNLGKPQNADDVVKEGLVDLVFLGRPALANPHWPVWAARELGYDNPFGLVPDDWGWWLRNFRGDQESMGFPAAREAVTGAQSANVAPTQGWKVDETEPDLPAAVDVEPVVEQEELKVA